MRAARRIEVSQTSGEKMTRDRLPQTSVSRKGRRRTARIAVSLVALLSIPLYGFLLPSNFSGTAAAGAMQLVRLNVVSEAGFVRIEITADGSFEDATVEHYSRGRQTVIRIRGARSLLGRATWLTTRWRARCEPSRASATASLTWT